MKFLFCKEKKSPTGKKVAIIGAGPSGLTVAGEMICNGHEVHVFDSLPEPGGLLIFGIPEWRIPKEPIKKGIEELKSAGVKFHLNHKVDDEEFSEILESYDAVFVGTGAWEPISMGLEGEDLEGVYQAMDYLFKVAMVREGYSKEEEIPNLGERVAVIGCGDVAMDACRTAKRRGAKEVFVIYRRSRKEAPATEMELQDAEKEGIEFMWLTNPTKFIGRKRVEKMELIKMKLGEPDSSGRPRPEPIPGSEFEMDVDSVILAIGQRPTPPFKGDFGIKVEWGRIVTDEEGRTTRKGVFAGGDVSLGPRKIGDAISTGKKAARAMEMYLSDGYWP
ncbi:glutamate synthase [Thermococci archaeon]|nr:MAG: glutamate synthase [Thermococci archaeon]